MVRVVDCHAGVLDSNSGGPKKFPPWNYFTGGSSNSVVPESASGSGSGLYKGSGSTQLGLKSSRPLSQVGPGSTWPESCRLGVFSERSDTYMYMIYGLGFV